MMVSRSVHNWGPRVLPWFLFICLFFSPAGQGLYSQDLKIGTIDVAPFGMVGTDGKPTGMMFEIANKIAETAGLKYTNTLVPYARSVLVLSDGSKDFVLRFSNPDLETVATQAVSVVSMPTIIVGLKGLSLNTLTDLHGKSVGLLRGGRFDDKFANDSLIKKVEAENYDQILKMLLAKRFDAAIGSNVGLYYIANKQGVTPDQLSSPLVLGAQDFVLHFSKKNTDKKTVNALVQAVEKLKKDGTIKAIINKYMGTFPWDVGAK